MKDFKQVLGDHLEELARAEEERYHARRAGRRRVRLARVGAIAVVLAISVVVALELLPGPSEHRAFASLPVLERSITDASHIPIAPELRRNGADLRRARAFDTPLGRGYAIPRTHGGLCVVIPTGSGDYAQGCVIRAVV